ncbi:hypothetical protein [Paenibacillus cremeus]|uniref:Uncharacterized protein n=1 Tax=Paenibacillus cremeus TaxID=2163881 RepID=A0A559K7W6_9BACL|nr:hypothetical protein [Paenibacillus cremeus]TVY08229.1 hypothetical protein FPZ49_20225 [Paenibacillus cremeus]
MSGVASGIFSTSRYIGGMIASVMVSMLGDYHLLFYVLLIMALLGVPVFGGTAGSERIPVSADKPSA